jgi:hypothetical protein
VRCSRSDGLGGTVALSDRAWSARSTRSTYGARRSHLNRANGFTDEVPRPVADSKITSRWLNANSAPRVAVAGGCDLGTVNGTVALADRVLVPCQTTFERLTSSCSAWSCALRFRQRM